MKIQESIAIVTGASSGIGRATAIRLAELGATVILAARRADYLQALVQEISQAGGRAFAIQTDVTKEEDINRLVSLTLTKCGRIDILVNVAGVGYGSSIL